MKYIFNYLGFDSRFHLVSDRVSDYRIYYLASHPESYVLGPMTYNVFMDFNGMIKPSYSLCHNLYRALYYLNNLGAP